MHSVGLYSIVASTGFDPATLSLTGWWRGSYTGSPWVGTASAGTSGTNNATEATNPPSAGTAVSGFTPAHFDNTNDLLTGAGTSMSDYFSSTQYAGWILCNVATMNTDSATEGINEQLIGSKGSQRFGIFLRNTAGTKTVRIYHFNGTNNTFGASTAISTGAWQLVQFRYKTNLDQEIRVNNGAWNTGARDAAVFGAGIPLFFGLNVLENDTIDGDIMEVGLTNTALTDTQFDDIRSYINTRYGLSV